MADVAPRVVAAAVPPVLTDNIVRGIMLVVVAYMIWALGDATAKLVIPGVGVGGAMLWRGVFGAVTVFAVVLPGAGGWRRLIPRRWKLVLVRSVLSSFVSVTWYVSWMTMSLADTYAVGYTAPLIMTLLAVAVLGERLRWRRTLSTAIGFVGVMVMLRPGGDLWTPVVLLLLTGTVVMAVTRIMTRQLSATETAECQAFWLLIGHMLTGLLLLPFLPGSGAAIGPVGWWELVFLGVSSGVAHCVFVRGYGLAPVSALAPYEYSGMPFAIVFGYALFGDVPSWATLGGAAVVAASGSYNAYRERVRRGEPA